EIVLAWVLEHLTGVSKERLLEIYLNIIEWGPGIHGADEAARFYFDRDARDHTRSVAIPRDGHSVSGPLALAFWFRWHRAPLREGADALHRSRDDREGLALARCVAA